MFDISFLAPYKQDPPEVNIPVIFVLGATYRKMIGGDSGVPPPTNATITTAGLIANLDDYYALLEGVDLWDSRLRTLFNISPFFMVLLCYYAFFKTGSWRSPAVAARAPAAAANNDGPQIEGGNNNAAPPQVQPVAAQPTPLPSSGNFSEHEMATMQLPVPPHLSGAPMPSTSNNGVGLSDVALDINGGRRNSVDEHKENEGLMSSPQPGSLRNDNRSGLLGRPVVVALAIPLGTKLHYLGLKALSAVGKPAMILRLNGAVYAFHALVSFIILCTSWNQSCPSQNIAVVSLFCARALIGFRICWWQCRSSGAIPMCADIFFKNWSDAIYLFSGTMVSRGRKFSEHDNARTSSVPVC